MAANQTANFVVKAKDAATGPLGKIGGSMGKLNRTAGIAFKGIASAVAAAAGAIIAFAVDGIKKAVAFEKAMLNVNSIAKATPEAFEQMKDSILDLSTRLPQSAETLAEGLYDISSSGFAGAEGIVVLEAAAKAASAGLAQTSESAAGITAVLNAYSYGADEAQRVSDILFKTVDRGVITFPELASSIGKVTALSAPLGVSLEDVSAGLAVLTKNGIDAENATTQLNAIMQAVLSPTGKATKLAKQLGINFTATGLRTKGLNGFMADLIKKTGGSNEKIAQLLGDARAIRGAFVLAKNGGAQFNEELALMEASAGATDTALGFQKQGLAYQMGLLENSFNKVGIELGEKFIPALRKGVDFLREKALPAFEKFLADIEPIFKDLVDNYIGPLVDSIADLATEFDKASGGVSLLEVALFPLKVLLTAIKLVIDGIVAGIKFMQGFGGAAALSASSAARDYQTGGYARGDMGGQSSYLNTSQGQGTYVFPISIGTGKVDTVVADSIRRIGPGSRRNNP
jgi:TP901 family phage tail tape measure protein